MARSKTPRQPAGKRKTASPQRPAATPDTGAPDKLPLAQAHATAVLPATCAETKPEQGPVAQEPTQQERRPACPVPLSAWSLCGGAVRGLAHHRSGLPCQDDVAWHASPRPILTLSDGAGSAPISELGAATLVRGVSRFLVSLEDAIAPWLDDASDTAQAQAQAQQWSQRLLIHAQGLLADLAHAQRRDVRDVRGTLLVVVIGAVHCFWWQVGDGAIVVQTSSDLKALGSTHTAKGEFANQTCFVDIAKPSDVQFGLLPTSEVHGMALMSDGGAEKLVAYDGSRVAQRVGKWLEAVARGLMSPEKIAIAYQEPQMWERTNLDDRSIVLAARLHEQSGAGAT